MDTLIKKASNRVTIAERKVNDLEEKKAELETKMNNPECASDSSLFNTFNQIEKELMFNMEEWEKATEELEELEKRRN